VSLANIRIVLVEPSHPGNIGAAARALKTMGLGQLVLVAPRRYPDPQAEWRAAGAADVLAGARVCTSLDQAIGDCTWVVGTSTRARRIPWPAGDATTIAGAVLEAAAAGPVAVLFGRESSGLSNEELQRCHVHLLIPADPVYPSLNLAMAVQVVAYEIFRQSETRPVVVARWDRPRATVAEVEGLLDHFERALVDAAFLDPANPGQAMTRLRRMIERMEADATEVQLLRGVITALSRGSSASGQPE
jgi:tRNA (cytidine32/uridine32-2'-O)-methyltransferase